MKNKQCPKCNKEMDLQDDSFIHEFGTEIIISWYCDNCNTLYSEDLEEIE